MKLEMQMTARDKKLLFFLGIFVIVVCFGWWGVKPAIKSISETNKLIEQAQEAKMIIDMKIAELPLIEADNKKLEEDILKAREEFYPMMTSSEIDKMFTGMVLDYNLYAYDLDINLSDEVTNLGAYQYSQKYQDDINKRFEEQSAVNTETYEDESDEYNIYSEYTQEVETTAYDNSATGIYTAKVGLRVGGTKEDLQKLINDLSSTDKKLRLCTYSWDTVRGTTYSESLGDYEVNTKDILYLTLEFYMCEE